jgi:hypothetical protein
MVSGSKIDLPVSHTIVNGYILFMSISKRAVSPKYDLYKHVFNLFTSHYYHTMFCTNKWLRNFEYQYIIDLLKPDDILVQICVIEHRMKWRVPDVYPQQDVHSREMFTHNKTSTLLQQCRLCGRNSMSVIALSPCTDTLISIWRYLVLGIC